MSTEKETVKSEKEKSAVQFLDKTDKTWYLCKKDKQIILCKSVEELIEDKGNTETIEYVVINDFKKEKKESAKENDTEKTTFTICIDNNGNSILLKDSNKLK